MSRFLNDHDSQSIESQVTERSHKLFKVDPKRPELQVSCLVGASNGKLSLEYQPLQTLLSRNDIRLYSKRDDPVQAFIIRQKRTWETLDISRELLQNFFEEYEVFHEVWKAIFTFGRKYEENEFQFPGLKTRRTPLPQGSDIFGKCFHYESPELELILA